MKRSALVLACLVVLCLAARSAVADEILLGTPHDQVGGTGGGLYIGQSQAEGFYLTQSVTLTGINIGVFTDTENELVFELANAIGPAATASNILAAFAVPSDSVPVVLSCPFPVFAGCQPYLSLAVPSLVLRPGEYFLLGGESALCLNAPLCGGAIWESETSVLPSSVGAVGPRFSSASVNTGNLISSDWQEFTADTSVLDFQLIGTVNAATEPSTFLLFATGLLAFLVIRQKQTPRRSHGG